MAILKAVLHNLLKKKMSVLQFTGVQSTREKKIREGTSNFSYFENILGKVNLY